jgi:O-antigen/teichoic acid export membrane protein
MLNYALVPFFTYIFGKPADFGLNVEFYAYISFLNILFTYGMETALFNFSVTEINKERVYSTALISVIITTVLLSIPFLAASSPIANVLRYPGHTEYILWAILIVGSDAIANISFAKLREENRAKRFVKIKMTNIAVQVFLNLFFVGLCKYFGEKHPGSFLGNLYDPKIGIGYAFIANLAANILSLVMLSTDLARIRAGFDLALWKRMLGYSLPLLIVGFGGMINETMDRILIKNLLPEGIAESKVGIYGACYKISILMTLFIMAFRYAAEPFFFSQKNEKNAPELYAKVMLWFVILCSLIFLGTTLNLSWIQYFVGKSYRVGLPVVPILLLANLFLGMYFNLSIWYKLTGRTRFGMWITVFGAAVTLILNFAWIPSSNQYVGGYMGSAWATLICYGSMMIISYFIGQIYYPVKYNVGKILGYLGLAIGMYFIAGMIQLDSKILSIVENNLFVAAFIIVVLLIEKPKLKT